ncbi:hypothetical protein Q8F55_002699 [Vanrija albida]|uniref:Uncharacterized protein n=1 Tax=Vanrija albida TaxID=181172 RepID=A0ABR3QAL4_9TREE
MPRHSPAAILSAMALLVAFVVLPLALADVDAVPRAAEAAAAASSAAADAADAASSASHSAADAAAAAYSALSNAAVGVAVALVAVAVGAFLVAPLAQRIFIAQVQKAVVAEAQDDAMDEGKKQLEGLLH